MLGKTETVGLLMVVGVGTGIWAAAQIGPVEASSAPAPKKEVLPGLYFTQPDSARPHPHVQVIHDEYHRVTCWHVRSYKSGGISCIPDSQLAVEPRPTE